MTFKSNNISNNAANAIHGINQGDCVKLVNDKDLFQVIGVDDNHKKCWVRRWPLLTNGSPVFEIPTSHVITQST